tara:strand:- start:682 stop:1290 length:609 start_codon:yes stop_codon:yes gene_type:complete
MKLFSEYFQKSKIFLYPLLGIEKGADFVPHETYISWRDEYSIDDMFLLCLYKEKSTKAFEEFEYEFLLGNKHFFKYYKLKPSYHLYVFDLRMYPQSWVAFQKGMYSKMYTREKDTLQDFFGIDGILGETVESYLYPEYYHDDYAEKLEVNIEMLQEVHETCSKPDLVRENLLLKADPKKINHNELPLTKEIINKNINVKTKD